VVCVIARSQFVFDADGNRENDVWYIARNLPDALFVVEFCVHLPLPSFWQYDQLLSSSRDFLISSTSVVTGVVWVSSFTS